VSDEDRLRRYLEAAVALGRTTKAHAEELLRQVIAAGEAEAGQARTKMEDVVERSRKVAEDLLAGVRSEVSNQLSALGLDPEQLAARVADLVRSVTTGRPAAPGPGGPQGAPAEAGATKGPVRNAAATKGPVRKAAATKVAGTKVAKKATTGRAPTKQATAGTTRRRPSGS